MQNKHQLEWAKDFSRTNMDAYHLDTEELISHYQATLDRLAQAIIADAEAQQPELGETSRTTITPMPDTSKVNRLEVIDSTSNPPNPGRAYTRLAEKPFNIELDYQDQGKTLKIFLKDD